MFANAANFVDILRYQAEAHPKKVAFTFLPDGEESGGCWSYAELDQQARRIAAFLNEHNAAGERALLLYPPGLEFIAAFFGCLYAGVIAVPAYPPRPNRSFQRLESIIQDSQAAFALTTTALAPNLSKQLATTTTLQCLATDKLPDDLANYWAHCRFGSEQLAFLQYTSGSTGTPKGVMVSHGNLLHNSALINQCFQDTEDSVGLSWLPPYHDMGLIGGILQPIYVGLHMVLMPPVAFLQRPARWLQGISKYRATSSGGPNFAFELCVNQVTAEQRAALDLSCWQLAFTGAEPVRSETLQKFAAQFADCGFEFDAFHPTYGMAEGTLMITGIPRPVGPRLNQFNGDELEQNQATLVDDGVTLVSCGQAWHGQTVLVVNPETRCPCEPGQVGEIWVQGGSVAQGYWQRAEQTQESFQAHLATGERPFLRTGDLGFFLADELYVTGRLKDLIIIRGRNHYPQDLEQTVESAHPSLRVGSSAAFAIEQDGQECLVIAVEVKRSALRRLDGNVVLSAIRQAIVRHHELQPAVVVLLRTGNIPKTSSGKIARHACRIALQTNALKIVAEWRKGRNATLKTTTADLRAAPIVADSQQQHEIQGWLVAQIASRLSIRAQEIDLQEPFASYGLDSVQAVQLTAQLEDWLKRPLSPTLAYDYPNISALAAHLAGLEPVSEDGTIAQPTQTTEIAIVGLSCRFPGGETPAAFWELLARGEEGIAPVLERWQGADWAGFLSQVDGFDASFFGISPREARQMDPQQRLLLEVAWEALEHGGLVPQNLAGSQTGVFVGISSHDYLGLQLRSQIDSYAGTGGAQSIAANRLSFFFDWRGPSLTVDTACSSSLVAVHLACQALQRGECERALVGGVNLILGPELHRAFERAGMLAPDGRCKTFSADADGYVRGEGCGVIVLQPLEQALNEGRTVLATIRGSAINQDGRSNGLTAPNGLAQQQVIRQALANAGVSPQQLSYVEAHGTGTALGDPIELSAIQQVLGERTTSAPCWIGSVKTNIGHLEAAAGIAGLIKIVLALQAKKIPPHRNFSELNPHIREAPAQWRIPLSIQPWLGERRLAGVSSFGFGGTNAHVILGDPSISPTPFVTSPLERPYHLLLLSGKTPTALQAQAANYQSLLQEQPDINLPDLVYSHNLGRSQHSYRLTLLTASTDQLLQQLTSVREQRFPKDVWQTDVSNNGKPRICFLFTGQGSQYPDMGRQLYETQPTFRRIIDHCDQVLRSQLERPLLAVLYPTEPGDETLIHQTTYTQPALFSVEYALAKLWQSWGVQPAVVCGHSVGEYVAACVAGVFSLEDGLMLIAQRGRLMQTLTPPGAMAAIFAELPIVEATIQEASSTLAIAALNGSHIAISGDKEGIKLALDKFRAQGVRTRQLTVSQGFHSPLMEPMLVEFARQARTFQFAPPHCELITNITGQPAGPEIATPDYWVEHVQATVKFAPSLEFIGAQDSEQPLICLELGPKPTLTSLGRYCLPRSNVSWLPSLRAGKEDWLVLLSSLAQIAVSGIDVDWQGVEQDYPRSWISLPTYPFERKHFWLKGDAKVPAPQSLSKDWFYQFVWQSQTQPHPDQSGHALKDPWLVLADQQGVGQAIQDQLAATGQACWLLFAQAGKNDWEPENHQGSIDPQNAEAWRSLWETEFSQQFAGIVYLWDLDRQVPFTGTDLADSLASQSQELLNLLKALANQKFSGRLWLVTQQAQKAIPSDITKPVSACLWGYGAVIALEHPEFWGGLIDVDRQMSNADKAVAIAQELLSSGTEERVAWRNGERYAARLEEAAPRTASSVAPSITAEGTYLIAGGLGALGRHVAQWLIEEGAKHIVLVGRRPPNESLTRTLKALARNGANIQIENADISDANAVRDLLTRLHKHSASPLRGVINAAGTLNDSLLINQSWAQTALVYQPKILGTWHLYQLTANYELDFFWCFSSVATLLGSPGQGAYAAANAFMDSLAHHAAAQGRTSFLSINWGPWQQGGMADVTSFAMKGLNFISPEQGRQGLRQLLRQDWGHQVGVFQVNWSQLQQQFTWRAGAKWLENLGVLEDADTAVPTTAYPSILGELLTLPSWERPAYLQRYLQSLVADILEVETVTLTPELNLLDTGLDSLAVMEILNRIKTDLQLMLYPREFYERPRLGELAPYLAQEFTQNYEQPTSSPTADITRTPVLAPPPPITAQTQKLPGIVFILSSPRSGSTLLRVMLAGHPRLLAPPELHLLPFATLSDRESQLAESHLGEGLQRVFMELKALDGQASADWVQTLLAQDPSVRDVYALISKLAGDRRLVDKSPTYGYHRATLDRAEALFENAQYIHLVRHPYAVVESFCRLRMDKLLGLGQGDPYDLAEGIWRRTNHNIQEFLATVPQSRQYRLRYEDLVTDPADSLKGLCQFLGLSFVPELLDPYRGDRMTDGPYRASLSLGDPNFLQRQQIEPRLATAWQTIRLPQPLAEESQQLAQDFAYELPHAVPEVPLVESTLSVRGLNLGCCHWGVPEKPTVLCLHGILEHGGEWNAIAQSLVQFGYSVCAPDLRGHGLSDWVSAGGAYYLLDFLADIDRLVPQLFGERPFTLVGHSLGAVIATLFARSRPEQIQNLILVEPVLPTAPQNMGQQLRSQLNYLSKPPSQAIFAAPENAAARLQQVTSRLNADEALKLVQRQLKSTDQGWCWRWDPQLRTRAALSFNGLPPEQYLQILSEIEIPLTAIFGDGSDFNRPGDLQQQQDAIAKAGGKSLTLSGGHNLHLEAPLAIAQVIQGALNT